MKYMFLIYGAEGSWNEQEFQDCISKSLAICEELQSQGKLLAASPLHSIATATSVRIRDGRRQITDGPFAETVEHLGGYYVLDVENLDEAIAIASRLPPVHKGTVEIRPLYPLPERPMAGAETFRRDVHIAAPPPTVYRALTTQAGVEGWWTATCSVSEEVGGVSTVHFDRTFKTFRVEELLPSSVVRWKCTEARLEVPGHTLRPDEWVGTRIEFALRPDGSQGTLLSLEHVGLGPHFDCYDICSSGWDQFLASLKQYSETGIGSPFAGSPIPAQSLGK